jgi:hypothetical protein
MQPTPSSDRFFLVTAGLVLFAYRSHNRRECSVSDEPPQGRRECSLDRAPFIRSNFVQDIAGQAVDQIGQTAEVITPATHEATGQAQDTTGRATQQAQEVARLATQEAQDTAGETVQQTDGA